MTLLDLLEDSLATYRLTRLVTKDKIAEPLRHWWIRDAYAGAEYPAAPTRQWARDALEGRNGQREDPEQAVQLDPEAPKLAYFITCPWCVGIWIALLCALLRWILPAPAWRALRRMLATSAIAALVETQAEA